MMLGAPFLLIAIATTAEPSSEQVSMRCANAIAKVIAYARSMEADARERGVAAGDVAAYDKALCVQSRKEPGRTFVSLVHSSGLIREHGRVYVVEPSGDVRIESGFPCDESSSPHVCG